MNSVFPYSDSLPSLRSSNFSESNLDLAAVSAFETNNKETNTNITRPSQMRSKKLLTKAMERWLLGFQILMIILFALFVKYDPQQADPIKSAKEINQRLSDLYPVLYDERVIGVVPHKDPALDLFGPHPQHYSQAKLQNPTISTIEKARKEWLLAERDRLSRQTIQAYSQNYANVTVMVFIGFGFLMTFLKKYGYSATGLTMILSAVAIQWSILCRGVFRYDEHGMINVEITSLINADFAAAAVLISFGGVLGVTSPFQLLIMVLIEVFLYSLNEYIGAEVFKAIDVGGSMFIHAFGAYFGLALSKMLKPTKEVNSKNETADKTSDLFAMIGTIFLWIYWPSFNGALASGDDQHRAVINTLLSLTASLIVTFVWSGILHEENKLNMVHIQNATLAGGVAVGAVADLMLRPFGALILGSLAGTISTLGYVYLTPFLMNKMNLHDTCGVHNLHGMPGVIGGIAGTIMAALANEDNYGNSLYQQYPARAPHQNSSKWSELVNEFSDLQAGENRTAHEQAMYQLATLAVTIAIAVVGGSATGLLLRASIFDNVPNEQHFDDVYFWEIPDDDEKKELVTKKQGITNKTFDSNFEMGMESKNADTSQL